MKSVSPHYCFISCQSDESQASGNFSIPNKFFNYKFYKKLNKVLSAEHEF